MPAPLFAHRDHVYWSSDVDIYRCPATGCAATPEVVALDANAGDHRLVFDEARVYWIGHWLGRTAFLSAPLDGSEPTRLVTQLAGPERALRAVGQGYLYWTAGKQVSRCAIGSCDASPPTPLATADVEISQLEIDDTAMYWLAGGTIHSCPLAGCEQASVLTPPNVGPLPDSGNYVENKPLFAIDASDVYWVETDVPSDERDQARGTAIRKAAK